MDPFDSNDYEYKQELASPDMRTTRPHLEDVCPVCSGELEQGECIDLACEGY